jgi:hypothetical protein
LFHLAIRSEQKEKGCLTHLLNRREKMGPLRGYMSVLDFYLCYVPVIARRRQRSRDSAGLRSCRRRLAVQGGGASEKTQTNHANKGREAKMAWIQDSGEISRRVRSFAGMTRILVHNPSPFRGRAQRPEVNDRGLRSGAGWWSRCDEQDFSTGA